MFFVVSMFFSMIPILLHYPSTTWKRRRWRCQCSNPHGSIGGGQALQLWLLHGDDRCVDSLMNVPREVKFRVVLLALQSIEREEWPNAGRQNPVTPRTEHLESAGPATSATATTSNEAI